MIILAPESQNFTNYSVFTLATSSNVEHLSDGSKNFEFLRKFEKYRRTTTSNEEFLRMKLLLLTEVKYFGRKPLYKGIFKFWQIFPSKNCSTEFCTTTSKTFFVETQIVE